MRVFARLSLAGLMIAAVAGCQVSNPGDVSFDAIRYDPSPELQGLLDLPVDAQRNLAVSNNQNWRMMMDDLGRMLYTDHPSRLSPYPITYTSGNPR